MRRAFFLILALVLVASLVSAAPSQPANARQGVEITVWATGSEGEAAVMQAAADLWAAQTGNTVVIEPVGWDTAHARALAAATSGEGPDIITGGLSWGIEFGALGGMVDLNAEYPDDVAAMAEAANPAIWASIVSRDGTVYAVPWDLTIYLMYYRSDLLAELDLEVPQTWEDIITVHEAIREANDGEGGFVMQWGNLQWLTFANYLYQAGGNFYDTDCNVTIDSDEGLEALEFYSELYTEYGVSQDGWPDLEGGLNSGLYPVGVSGNWIVGGLDSSYPDMAGKWAVSALPAGPAGRTAFIGGRVIGVMSFSDNQAEAVDFIKFLYTPEAVQAEVAAGVNQNIMFIPPQSDFLQYVAYGDNVREAVQAQLAEAMGPPNCPGWEEAANEVQFQIEGVITEGADPEEALINSAVSMEELLGD